MKTLVLGSGAAKGLSHIGVLKVMEQEGLLPEFIVGCSIGALVGGLYAAGLSAEELEELAVNFKKTRILLLFEPANPLQAFINSEKIADYLEGVLPVKRFSELKRPFACVATNLNTGELEVFTEGELLPAIMASIAIPIIFPPVQLGEHFLVDGGVKSPLPVRPAEQLGATRIVAVSLLSSALHHPDRIFTSKKKPSSYAVATRAVDIMQAELCREDEKRADLVIVPEVANYNFYEFFAAAEIIEKGIEAAQRSLTSLRSLFS